MFVAPTHLESLARFIDANLAMLSEAVVT